MTVANQTNRTSAVGSGSTGQEIPFLFPIKATSDLAVYKRITATGVQTTLAETTNYTVVINGDAGGTVTTVTTIETTEQIHLVGNAPYTQSLDLVQGGNFNAENIEDALDKNTRLAGQNKDLLDNKALLFPASDPSLTTELPSSIDRASKVIASDSAGNITAIDAVPEGSVAFSTFGTNMAEAANALAGKAVINLDHVFDVRDYGAVGDGDGAGGGTDDTAAIQAAIDAAIAVKGLVVLPYGTSGVYKITDTLLLGRGDSGFDTVSMTGPAMVSGAQGITIDAISFLDRPAVNINGARGVELANVYIIGGNVAPATATGDSDTESDYLTAGATYAQYNPYAGVSIDGYSGADPGATGYPGTYGKSLSSGVRLTNLFIKNFVIGVTNHPCNSNSQGDDIILDKVVIDECAYGFGVHGTQNRGNYLRNCEINDVRTAIITGKYGPQSGINPKIEGGVWVRVYRFFNVGNTRDLLSVNDLYVEGFMTMGNLGAGVASAMKPASFKGCLFRQRITGDTADLPPIIALATFTPTVFNGCRFETRAGIFNTIGKDIVFNSCNWRAIDTWNDQMYIGHSFIVADPPIDMQGCTYQTDLYAPPPSTINGTGYIASFATPERLIFTPASRLAVDTGGTYKYVRGSITNYVSSIISGVSWDTNQVTFTAATIAEFAEGDILFWKTAAQTNISDTKFDLPAVKITDITGSVVTADTLYNPSDYDKTWDPTTAYIVQREWAPGIACRGNTTAASTSVTNVTGTGCMKVGDFIKGDNIPTNTRITVISGTTVTISKNATRTAATKLYFAEVVSLDAIEFSSMVCNENQTVCNDNQVLTN